ncbi:serine/threonine-protein kinase [Paraliomyxa miuraensis]|uniref:serine/threonine-protein kinase n=1 Tax=Paraliomyxa miuraensis TaxID=376150 RepID=UPI0022584CE8|nr:serine/threonine-protein kinase [Paraliomyxa miuraensis]MCX4247822.1 serine/threonine protein kinase [Paraliomyxa miuraensis]
MSDALPWLPWPHRLLEGPCDVGTEQRWHIELSDGRRAVVGQLAADLARDESIRRRWVRDAERMQGLAAHALAPTLALGPEPDPRDPAALAPWRVRLDPAGETLESWLRRAPATIEELSAVFVGLADALQSVHATGAVLRDLRPSQIVRTPDGRVILVDVGLSRVDVLSSHTASSLLMQGSAYAAPEQIHATAVDQRSDLYSLGVMMWQALTGELPFGDGPAFMREPGHGLPPLVSLRRDVPPALELLVRACLDDDPSRRPATASDVSWVLRGGAPTSLMEHATTVCQHCGTRLRVGQRLCLSCGRVSVRFVPAMPGEPEYGVDLCTIDEDARKLEWLQGFVRDIAEGQTQAPEFLVGPTLLYAEEERRRRIRLPARLFGGLSEQTAVALHEVMRDKGLDTKVVGPPAVRSASMLPGGIAGVMTVTAVSFATLGWGTAFGVTLGVGLPFLLLALNRYNNVRQWVQRTIPRFRLRALPAALPASDPLVARLAALLHEGMPGDVREVVGELALLVQRLVDHRAAHVRDHRELDMLVAPLQPLVGAVERLVGQLHEIGRELAELDEGAMVRALAASTARREGPEQRAPILQGLDRLRALEDRRAEVFHRLLEARSLLTRTVELGLAVHDEGLEHQRSLAMAMAALGEG